MANKANILKGYIEIPSDGKIRTFVKVNCISNIEDGIADNKSKGVTIKLYSGSCYSTDTLSSSDVKRLIAEMNGNT